MTVSNGAVGRRGERQRRDQPDERPHERLRLLVAKARSGADDTLEMKSTREGDDFGDDKVVGGRVELSGREGGVLRGEVRRRVSIRPCSLAFPPSSLRESEDAN